MNNFLITAVKERRRLMAGGKWQVFNSVYPLFSPCSLRCFWQGLSSVATFFNTPIRHKKNNEDG